MSSIELDRAPYFAFATLSSSYTAVVPVLSFRLQIFYHVSSRRTFYSHETTSRLCTRFIIISLSTDVVNGGERLALSIGVNGSHPGEFSHLGFKISSMSHLFKAVSDQLTTTNFVHPRNDESTLRMLHHHLVSTRTSTLASIRAIVVNPDALNVS